MKGLRIAGAAAALAAVALALPAGCAAPRATLGSSAERLDRARRAAVVEAQRSLPPISAETGPLTPVAAVRRALAGNADVLAAEHDARIARAAVAAARDGRDPELRAGYRNGTDDQTESSFASESLVDPLSGLGGYTTSSNRAADVQSSDSDSYAVALRFYPRNPWALRAGLSRARAAACAAEARLRQCVVDTALEACRLYDVARFAAEDLDCAEETARIRGELADQVQQRLKAGQMTVAESVRARQLQLAAVSDVARARRDLAQARQDLARWVGVPFESTGTLVSWAPPMPNAAGWQADGIDLAAVALSNRADVAALGWDAQALWAAYREAYAARWPWFSYVQAGYAWADQSTTSSSLTRQTDLADGSTSDRVETRDRDSNAETWRVDAGVTLPVFSWLGHEADVCRAEYEKARAVESHAILDLADRVAASAARVRVLADEQRRYADESVPVLEELNRLVAATATTSDLTPEERARVQEEVVRSRRLAAETAHTLNQAVISLHAALGTLPVPAVEQPEAAR